MSCASFVSNIEEVWELGPAHAPVRAWKNPLSLRGMRSAMTMATKTCIAPEPTPCMAGNWSQRTLEHSCAQMVTTYFGQR